MALEVESRNSSLEVPRGPGGFNIKRSIDKVEIKNVSSYGSNTLYN
jgi:hypothetical protein